MPPGPARADPAVELPVAILERYTGYYALSASSVITVTRAGSRLMVQLPGQAAAEIYAQTAASFVSKTMDARIDFMPNPPVEITALVLHQQAWITCQRASMRRRRRPSRRPMSSAPRAAAHEFARRSRHPDHVAAAEDSGWHSK